MGLFLTTVVPYFLLRHFRVGIGDGLFGDVFFFMMGGNDGLDDPQVPTSIWGSEVGGVVGREEDHRYFVDVSTVPYC